MINLINRIGIPLSFDPESLEVNFKGVGFFKRWEKTLRKNDLWKSLKFASDYTDKEGNTKKEVNLWDYRNPDSILYSGYQGIYWNDKRLLKLIKQHEIRPDVTVLSAGTIDGEYIRTEGHEHLSGFPEIYETVYGKNGYLLFKTMEKDSEDIEDVCFVFAEKGDHVLFPPGYQHISVNIGEEAFLMTDWVSPKANTDFKYIKRHNGAPYWVVKGNQGLEFVKNPKYTGKVPEIRLLKPAPSIPELDLKKGEPMFNLVKDGKIEVLDFLNSSSDREFYEKAFVLLIIN